MRAAREGYQPGQKGEEKNKRVRHKLPEKAPGRD